MKNKTIIISLRVIALFLVAIFVSKIPDLYPSFFGDYKCEGAKRVSSNLTYTKYEIIGCDNHFGERTPHNPKWHWGYAHFLFFLMGLSLTIIQIVDIINYISKPEIKKPYSGDEEDKPEWNNHK
jgi:hypothetical protein